MSATGKWNVVMTTPMGAQNVVFDLVADGAELKGSMTGPNGTNTIDEGRSTGDLLSWRSKLTKPMPMELTFAAKIDGSKISGEAKGLFGTAPFSGSKA